MTSLKETINLTMPFKNMRTLKFKIMIQPTVMLFTPVNHCSGPLRKQKRLAQRGQNVMFVRCDWRISIHFAVGFCIFCGQSVVAVIMIDGSETRKSLGRVEDQSPYFIERRSISDIHDQRTIQ